MWRSSYNSIYQGIIHKLLSDFHWTQYSTLLCLTCLLMVYRLKMIIDHSNYPIFFKRKTEYSSLWAVDWPGTWTVNFDKISDSIPTIQWLKDNFIITCIRDLAPTQLWNLQHDSKTLIRVTQLRSPALHVFDIMVQNRNSDKEKQLFLEIEQDKLIIHIHV